MKVKYSPLFLSILKKVNVRTRKSLKERIITFSKNPNDLELNNHPLKAPYEGRRSIDVNSDWRAVYQEITEGDEEVAYFVDLGTHNELYKRSVN